MSLNNHHADCALVAMVTEGEEGGASSSQLVSTEGELAEASGGELQTTRWAATSFVCMMYKQREIRGLSYETSVVLATRNQGS